MAAAEMMLMPGMRMSGTHAGGTHTHVVSLLPSSLGVAAAVAFVAIAGSHVRHMLNTDGQRRPWHACHVLIAVGMAFMYLPPALDPFAVPLGFWRIVFACAGLVAALWAVGGSARVPVLMWTLTAVDLGSMLYMWSVPVRTGTATVGWLLFIYLLGSCAMWLFDVYRRIDSGVPLVSWQALGAAELAAAATGRATVQVVARRRGGSAPRAGRSAAARAVRPDSLLGELDIGISMIVMSLGMAYMALAMQLLV